MKVTQVSKGTRIFYLCDRHLEQVKVYNPSLVIRETGYSNCDMCNEELGILSVGVVKVLK